MNELVVHPWAFWITFAIAAAILEMMVGSFSFVFVCVAAILTALVASRFDWIVQLGVFGVTLLVTLGMVRPRFLSRIQSETKLPSRAEILVGKMGKVSQTIDPAIGLGRVEVEGQDWAAQSAKLIAIDSTVVIEGSDGIVLIVKEV
ncbi:MAG: NfeD family protein [Bdellovibrionia bacterium]